MRKRIRTNILITLLALFVLSPVCFAQDEEAIVKPAQKTGPDLSKQYDQETEKQIKQAQEKIKYTSVGLRDPFSLSLPQQQQGRPEAGPLPQFKIEGYIWGSSIPQAIIEGAVYSEGDMVKGAKIIKIDKNGITLLYNGNNYIIK